MADLLSPADFMGATPQAPGVMSADQFMGAPAPQAAAPAAPFSRPMGSATDFLKTAAIRAGGSLVDLVTQGPQGLLRQALFPDIADQEKKIDPMSAPGSVLADKTLDATGGAYQPENTGQRLALSATTGAMAGGPFGVGGALLGGAGGTLGQGAAEAGLPRWAQVGASFLPALAGKPAEILSRAPETKAISILLRRIAADEAAGGPGVPQIGSALAQADVPPWYEQKPLAIADVAGENVKGLGEGIATRPGEGQQIASQFLKGRDAGAGNRTSTDINDTLGTGGGNVFDTSAALTERQKTQAAPLYNEAYTANTSIASPLIDRILTTPAGKKALADARVKMQNDQSLMGLPDAELGDLAREQGMTVPGGVASGLRLRSLDYVKRSLDDQIGAAQRAGENDNARILIGLKSKLVGELDRIDVTATRDRQGNITEPGAYARGRAVYSEGAQNKDALIEGGKFLSKSPEQIASELSDLSPGEQAHYRLAAADRLNRGVQSTSLGGNEALKVVGNDYLQRQIRALYPNKADADQVIRAASNENLMATTKNDTLLNSRTARRQAEQAAQNRDGGVIGPALQIAGGFAAHEPFVGALGIPKLVRGIGERLGRPSPEVDAAIARMLFNSDLGSNQATLARIMQGLPQGNSYVGPSLLGAVPPAGLLGGPSAGR